MTVYTKKIGTYKEITHIRHTIECRKSAGTASVKDPTIIDDDALTKDSTEIETTLAHIYVD